MLTYRPCKPEQYNDFLQLMLNEAADYLKPVMEKMHLTMEQYEHLLKTVGEVYGIYQDENLAGFYWTEERERTLHLHGIVLLSNFQKKGIGSKVLKMLETQHKTRTDVIELGVHQTNKAAKQLYEKLGYVTASYQEALGFYIMQKIL
jgi:ribosomal protein S18 acetylase RimI-like enzyme